MGRKLGLVLVGLGVFLVALALLSRFYAYGKLAVVPLDQDTVSVSVGPDATIFDIGTQKEVTVDLVSTRNVVGEVKASETWSKDLGRDVAVWQTLVYTDKPGAKVSAENPPLSGTHDRVAFDRHTGAAIDCCNNFLSSTANIDSGAEKRDYSTPIEGQYFKLPFNAEKKTYQFWDGDLKKATDLNYKGTESIQGLTVYRYEQVIAPTVTEQITAPASYFGIDKAGDVQLDRVYGNTRTLWVEPETGVIIRGQENQNVVAEYNGQQVATLTNVVIGYNAKTIKDNVDTYAPLSTQLKIIRVWVPLVAGVLGVLLLIIGLAVMARGRSERSRRAA